MGWYLPIIVGNGPRHVGEIKQRRVSIERSCASAICDNRRWTCCCSAAGLDRARDARRSCSGHISMRVVVSPTFWYPFLWSFGATEVDKASKKVMLDSKGQAGVGFGDRPRPPLRWSPEIYRSFLADRRSCDRAPGRSVGWHAMPLDDCVCGLISVGLRPCSGAIIVLVFALAQGMFWAGVASTFVMGIGTAITVGTIATLHQADAQRAAPSVPGNRPRSAAPR